MADGRATASHVVEPMHLPTHRSLLGEERVVNLLDTAELAKVLQTVTGVCGAMAYSCKVGAAPERAEQIKAIVEGVLARTLEVFSLWVPGSEVGRINQAPRAEPVELSEDMSDVLQAVEKLFAVTKGMYDPACYPLMRYYQKHLTAAMRGFDEMPSGDPQATAIAQYAHWGSFILSKDGRTLTKTHDEAGLDLGGIAKGWAIDKCVGALVAAGFEDIYMEWGGDVRVKGHHPMGRRWSVAIAEPPSLSSLREAVPAAAAAGASGGLNREDPLRRRTVSHEPDDSHAMRRSGSLRHREGSSGLGPSPDSNLTNPVGEAELASIHINAADDGHVILAKVSLRDGAAICTSGDYMQAVWFGDRLFCHVFHPVERRLLEVTASALAQTTVVTNGSDSSCMYADALATAALAMGSAPKEARIFLDGFSSVAVLMEDYLLYAREGPKVIRRRLRGSESEVAREIRMSQHDTARVVVIGGGLAGFAAAIEAARAGAQVVLLEKEASVGGNSAKATSGVNGWQTRIQAQQGVQDDERYFERDTFRSGKGGTCDPSLVRIISTQSAEAIRWLIDEMDVDLAELSQLGGHSRKRTHRARPTHEGDPRPVGWLIMQSVQAYVQRELAGQVEIRTSARVVRLEVEQHHDEPGGGGVLPPRKTVTGVAYEDTTTGAVQTLQADAVVLATGGYGCDFSSSDSLLKQHRPDLVGSTPSGDGSNPGALAMPSTNGAFATGDGVKFGMAIGAVPVDLDKVQLHPTSFLDPKDPTNPTKILGPEALRGSGGILVNHEGRRFVNELDLRSVVSAAILKHCQPFRGPDGRPGSTFAWCILNDEAQAKFGLPSLKFYKDAKGLFESAADFPSLARDIIGCDPATLRQSIEQYARSVALGLDTATQKNAFPVLFDWEDQNLVLARVTPAIHYSMGGLRITAAAEVVEEVPADADAKYCKLRPIRGLFAAGEVTGGVHGENRLGGNSLLECVVFGRLAGERAGTIKQLNNDACLSEEAWTPVTFREALPTDQTYGLNTMVFRFNTHGALQRAGLDVGQFLAVRGELDGEWLQGYYSPLSRPQEEGYVEILCRTDVAGGKIIHFLNALRPGAECYVKAMGGLRLRFEGGKMYHKGRKIKQLALLAGGTGIAPMIQITRAYLHHAHGEGAAVAAGSSAPPDRAGGGVRLVYAAERHFDLAFTSMLEAMQEKYAALFQHYIVLNQPCLGWTSGVGYIDLDTIKKHTHFPPDEAKGQLFVICGPPSFEALMVTMLTKELGYPRQHVFAYSNPDV